jgi:hypothetical protein
VGRRRPAASAPTAANWSSHRPFVGALVVWTFFGDPATTPEIASLVTAAIGVSFVLHSDYIHPHKHDPLEHDHEHNTPTTTTTTPTTTTNPSRRDQPVARKPCCPAYVGPDDRAYRRRARRRRERRPNVEQRGALRCMDNLALPRMRKRSPAGVPPMSKPLRLAAAAFLHVIYEHRYLAAASAAWTTFCSPGRLRGDYRRANDLARDLPVLIQDSVFVHARPLIELYADPLPDRWTDLHVSQFGGTGPVAVRPIAHKEDAISARAGPKARS